MILVVVDRFTKMAHFMLIGKKDSPIVARAYLENVWKYHGFPEDVVSDRDRTFTGQFFTDLYNYFGINRSMSTAYHPQLDGQMERMNPVIQSYLRSYRNYEQHDWTGVLAIDEYVNNNSKHSRTKISALYANYGFKPRRNWPTVIPFRNPASELSGYYKNLVHSKLSKQLEKYLEAMRRYYDTKRKLIESSNKSEMVMHNGKNIQAQHRCKKFKDKMQMPFDVMAVGQNGRYCPVKLPESWRIHPTIKIALL